MRVLLLRALILAGCVAVALTPAPAQEQGRLGAEEHDKKLASAEKVRADSARDKKGKFTVAKIPGITDRPRRALANSIPPRPDDLKRAKSASRTLQKAPLRDAHLDPSFDLTADRVFPIRDQQQCGCCWIFGAVAAHEGNILFKNKNATIGLSEQYVVDRLVSSGQKPAPCDGGWFDMSLSFLRDEGTSTTSLFPYSGGVSNNRLDKTSPIPFKGKSVGFVGTSSELTPPVDEIKRAIAAYGAVTVAVYVGDAFQSYTGGVFGRGAPPSGEVDVNHAVALVGWDDNPPEFKDDPDLRKGTGGGVWILRNSWGPTWGEKGGYMRIAYNSSNVGYGAMFIEAEGGPEPPIVPPPGPTPTPGYAKQVNDAIKFYEKNYPDYVPKP